MEQGNPDQQRDAVALNHALVDQLKNLGWIQTPSVESAFRAVLRHQFLPATPWEEVYADRVILTKQDQNGQWSSSSSQPAIMAIMLEQLDLKPGHRVLEIGTGTGYNAALIAHIVGEAGQVVTIDIDQDLVEAAREHLAMAGFEQVRVVCADGGYGYAEAAPFDRIILTVGALDITPAWREQLKPEGRLVLPLMLKGSMKSIAFEQGDDYLTSVSVKDCSFMLLRGNFASAPSNEVQVGPSPNLYVETEGKALIDSDAVYELLLGVSKDWAANVEVTVWDVLLGNLWTWLALHDSRICKLVAKGDMVERNVVPPLVGVDGTEKSAGTVILVEKTGLVAMMRPPGQSAPMLTVDKLFSSDSPFGLFLRQYGLDDSLAQLLLAEIRAWDTAGRPSAGKMRIRAYPTIAQYMPTEDEIVLEKQWTKLVIEWQVSA